MNKNDYCSLDTSYLLNIDESEKKRFQNNESNEKQKYIDNSKTFKNSIIFPNDNSKKTNTTVDVDSFLRYPPNLYQNKTSVELKQSLDHNKYDLLYSNRMEPDPQKKPNTKKSNISIINDKPYIGAGRGIGDLDISELIRTGQDTRRYNDQYKEKQESHIIDRFQILDKNYQDPKHIVMDLPRGGVQTRKNKKLIDQAKKNNFNFNY